MSSMLSSFFIGLALVFCSPAAVEMLADPPRGGDQGGRGEEEAENPFDPDVGHIFYERSELSARELKVLRASKAQARRLERIAKTAFVCQECSGKSKKKKKDSATTCPACAGSKIKLGQEFKDSALDCVQAFMRLEAKYYFEFRPLNKSLKTWLLRKIKTAEAVRQINRDLRSRLHDSRLEPGQLVLASATVFRIERLKYTPGGDDAEISRPPRTSFYIHARLSPSGGKQHNLILPLYKLPSWLQDNSRVLLCGQFFQDRAYLEYGGTTQGSTHIGLLRLKRLPRQLEDSLKKDVDTTVGGC